MASQDVQAEKRTEVFERGTSLWKDAWLRLKQNKMAMFGLVLLVCLIFLTITVPYFSSYTYEAQDLAYGAQGPSWDHFLGTDSHGRDLLVRLMCGGQISLMVGLVASAVSLLIGVLYGTISGYFGGKIDALMMRFVDILYALPFTLFVIMLMVVFGRHLWLIFVAIGAVEWLTMARIVRGQVLGLKNREFIDAAQTIGVSKWRIILKHLLPNVMGPVIIYTTLTIPQVMLLEAFLSFLGLGVQPPMSSWGSLIASGVDAMEEYPWLLLFPGLAFSMTLFALNFLGDGLRDALDPRSTKSA